jgi:hypothetical protein
MTPLDILYTPLDTPLTPKTDIDKLFQFISEYSKDQSIENRLDASKISSLSDIYPWNLLYIRTNKNWHFDFNKEFPELADFFSSAYQLKESNIHGVVLLPVRPEFVGLGFWHSDPDPAGLRLYIENQETDDFLLIRPTVEPYNVRPNFKVGQILPEIPMQDKIHSAKLLETNQTFYINNIRAVHAVNTHIANTTRIAGIIIPEYEKVKEHIDQLIVNSAKKFSKHAIYWSNTNE